MYEDTFCTAFLDLFLSQQQEKTAHVYNMLIQNLLFMKYSLECVLLFKTTSWLC